MKSKWLLLMVSVLCLLVLFPAAALSQGPVIDAGCGTAIIDGVVDADEWTEAAVVDLALLDFTADALQDGGEVSPAQLPEGVLLAMNDLDRLYVATVVDMGFVADPDDWWSEAQLNFTDEGDPLDGNWDAPDCAPLPGEGPFWAWKARYGGASWDGGDEFRPMSQVAGCAEQPLIGVAWESTVGLVWEWAIDLTDSELDKIGLGDCFRFSSYYEAEPCVEGSGCGTNGQWYDVAFGWPAAVDNDEPDTYGTLCLNPCEADFVPEPGTIALLGTGLFGLAGYATLRLRTRK